MCLGEIQFYRRIKFLGSNILKVYFKGLNKETYYRFLFEHVKKLIQEVKLANLNCIILKLDINAKK